MQLPLEPDDRLLHCRRHRGPVALWPILAVIGVVLGTAALGAALTADTRDYSARHGSVLRTHAL